MRLIDADARMQWLEDNTTEEEWMVNQYNADWVYSILETSPTIDAVPVVRCKDCKHGRVFSLKKRLVDCPYHDDHMVDFDHFCSYGERKDGDD